MVEKPEIMAVDKAYRDGEEEGNKRVGDAKGFKNISVNDCHGKGL